MKIRHWKTVSPPNEGFLKVTSICWSSDGKKFAVSTSDRVVTIFDHDGNKKDKFSTKPSTEKVHHLKFLLL
jgi:intraflagellar transport protein 172